MRKYVKSVHVQRWWKSEWLSSCERKPSCYSLEVCFRRWSASLWDWNGDIEVWHLNKTWNKRKKTLAVKKVQLKIKNYFILFRYFCILMFFFQWQSADVYFMFAFFNVSFFSIDHKFSISTFFQWQ